MWFHRFKTVVGLVTQSFSNFSADYFQRLVMTVLIKLAFSIWMTCRSLFIPTTWRENTEWISMLEYRWRFVSKPSKDRSVLYPSKYQLCILSLINVWRRISKHIHLVIYLITVSGILYKLLPEVIELSKWYSSFLLSLFFSHPQQFDIINAPEFVKSRCYQCSKITRLQIPLLLLINLWQQLRCEMGRMLISGLCSK